MIQQSICGIAYTNCHNLDVHKNLYEGGQTLWDCTIDLLQYDNKQFQNKTVIDMGCGMGLLGIQALKQGAIKTIFQDFNQETLQIALKPQLMLNFPILDKIPFQFVYGDWDDIQIEKVDIIVASEIIYREENYKKVESFINRHLNKNGCCYMVNKSYYFGVGGSAQGFKNSLTTLKVKEEQIINNKKGVKKVLQILIPISQ